MFEISTLQIALNKNQFPNLPTLSTKRGTTISQISFSDLSTTSNNWDKKMVIGQGMCGWVYKGVWKNSSIAIKRYSQSNVKDLLTEVCCLKAYRHKNIIPLIACSSDLRHLVYQYMPGGSLEKRLNTRDSEKVLTWQQRVNIATGIAEGIQYLHSGRKNPLIHGDIKTSNILLGSDDKPRIGDFGTAHECSHQSGRQIITWKIRGTPSYLPPEYLLLNLTSTKVDVYGFGVVLLQLATGLSSILIDSNQLKLLKDVVVEHKGNIHKLEDSRIKCGKEHFEVLLKVGKICVEVLPKSRPNMAEVLKMLKEVSPKRKNSLGCCIL